MPPYSEEAEKGALGSILVDADRMMPIVHRMRITPEAFYVPAHRMVAEAIFGLWGKPGKFIDLLTVPEELKQMQKLETVGGAVFVERLVDATPSAYHGEDYLDLVRQKHILRREILTCRQVECEAYTQERGDVHLKTIPERFTSIIGDVLSERTLGQMMDENLAKWEKAISARESGNLEWAPGLPLPWFDLWKFCGELVPGLHIIGGEQGSGKTTMEGQWAMHWAKNGHPVARCTLDVKDRELTARMLAREAGVSLPKFNFGFAGRSELQRAKDSRDLLHEIPMWINDQDRDVAGICAYGRAMKLRYGIEALTVDYAQKVNAAALGRNATDPVRRVAYVTGCLKDLALELGIPVLLLSQYSREQGKDSRKPVLGDLKDSSALEQDAHKVFLLWIDPKKRKSMEDPGAEQSEGIGRRGAWDATKHKRPVWLIKAKDKDADTGQRALWMFPAYFYFGAARFEKNDPFWDDALPGEAGASSEAPTSAVGSEPMERSEVEREAEQMGFEDNERDE